MQPPPFSALADVYDDLVADNDYEGWCDFVLEQAERHRAPRGPVLELGCGTGNMAIPLARRGLDVTGLDRSPQMLRIARGKAPLIDWRVADMTGFCLERRYSLVLSVFDTLNNLLDPELFAAAVRCVRRHLLPGGLFVFDVNTAVGLRDLWEGGRLEGWAGEVFYSWTHDFDEEARIARVEAYCQTARRCFTEVHLERAYEAAEVSTLLTQAGFGRVEVMAFPHGGAVESDAERIWVCALA
jgi:SAM-dependent methyltransferase